MSERDRPVYSIGAVERLVGLSAATIRTWESRYALIAPARSSGGQRLYSREQVDQLRFVKLRIESGRRPGEAHRVLAERLEADGSIGGGGGRAIVVSAVPGTEAALRPVVGERALDLIGGAASEGPGRAPTLIVVQSGELDLDDLAEELRQAGCAVTELELPDRH